MKYISGLYALNLPCSLDTSGDWHTSSLDWEKVQLLNTEDSPFGMYGIEHHPSLHGVEGDFLVANHIRACLDMLLAVDFPNLQGMNHDYICNAAYDEEIFHKVWELRVYPSWSAIKAFMEREYKMKWVRFQERKANEGNTSAAT